MLAYIIGMSGNTEVDRWSPIPTPCITDRWAPYVCTWTSLMLPTLCLWCRWAACCGASRELGLRAAPPRLGLGIPVRGAPYRCLQVTLQPCVAPATPAAFHTVSTLTAASSRVLVFWVRHAILRLSYGNTPLQNLFFSFMNTKHFITYVSLKWDKLTYKRAVCL